MQPNVQYNVTPEYVTAAGDQCNKTAGDIQVQLLALKQYVVGLEETWLGMASQRFNALMVDYDRYSMMLHNALVDIGAGLKGNAVNYVDTEIDNINNLQRIDGAFPGMPSGAVPVAPAPLPPAKL